MRDKIKCHMDPGWDTDGWEAEVFGAPKLSQGGWSGKWLTNRELQAAHDRAIKRAYALVIPEDGRGTHQCGGCRMFGAVNGDWGVCCNPASPNDLGILFEHGGCAAHSDFVEEGALRP